MQKLTVALLALATLSTTAAAREHVAVRLIPPFSHDEIDFFFPGTMGGLGVGYHFENGVGVELDGRAIADGINSAYGYELSALVGYENMIISKPAFTLTVPVRLGFAFLDGFARNANNRNDDLTQTILLGDAGLTTTWWGKSMGFGVRCFVGLAQPLTTSDSGWATVGTRFRYQLDLGMTFPF